MRAGDVGELILNDCAVEMDCIMPGSGGLRSPLSCLNQARYGISWGALGAAMDCYEAALNYTKERKQFGSPIAGFQLVQEKLVNMLMEITKGQLLSYQLGRLMDAGKARPTQISMAKRITWLLPVCAPGLRGRCSEPTVSHSRFTYPAHGQHRVRVHL